MICKLTEYIFPIVIAGICEHVIFTFGKKSPNLMPDGAEKCNQIHINETLTKADICFPACC